MHRQRPRTQTSPILFLFLMLGLIAGCRAKGGEVHSSATPTGPTSEPMGTTASDGPATTKARTPHQTGDVGRGKEVFRFETFGNEGFWTDAMRLPKGMMTAKFTPLQALGAGLQVDVEALDPATRDAMAAEFKTDLSAAAAPMLNDPGSTIKLINARAVIGVVPVDTNKDGKLDVTKGDKVGIACAICHTITDGSAYVMAKGGGTVGKRIDGPANLDLNMGALLAMASNSRAYYPNLQAELGGTTHGRAPRGLTRDSSEAEVDAYLTNPAFYPVGTFDETSDGIGNPVKNVPFLRTDLAGPWGSSASFAVLDHIGNGSYTMNLDLTTLVTPEGRKFLKEKGGKGGEELAESYAHILKATGVTGIFVTAKPKAMGPDAPVGLRVDDQKLFDMNAYTDSLPAPKAPAVDAASAARGREIFRKSCTTCHNVDQSRVVPQLIVDMKTIFPDYAPVLIEAREAPLSPIQDSPGIFDDKMIVEDASERGEPRGVAMPLLVDLARTTLFLHDASVTSLGALLDPVRGAGAPHPFYVADVAQRADTIEFLKGLDASAPLPR